MILQRVGISLFTLIAIVSIVLAAATIWHTFKPAGLFSENVSITIHRQT